FLSAPASADILLPIAEDMLGRPEAPPLLPCRLDRLGVRAVEKDGAKLKAIHTGRSGAIDQKEILRPIGVLVLIGEPDRLRVGKAIACTAVRQERAIVVGPEERAERLHPLLGTCHHDSTLAALQGLLQKLRQSAIKADGGEMIEAHFGHHTTPSHMSLLLKVL